LLAVAEHAQHDGVAQPAGDRSARPGWVNGAKTARWGWVTARLGIAILLRDSVLVRKLNHTRPCAQNYEA
jgi:hypothetical protein